MKTRLVRIASVFIAVLTLTRVNTITAAEPPPIAGFDATHRSGIRPLTVNFDTSTGVVSTWLWNFGDTVTSTVYLPIILRQNPKLFGRALSLDGVDDYASAPDSASLDLGTGYNDDFTIETFFYVPNLTDTGFGTLIWKPGAYGLLIVYDASAPDQLILRIWSDTAPPIDLSYNVDLAVGWHHVAAVFDNETTGGQDLRALYLDGSQVASNDQYDWDLGIPDSTSDLDIGGYPAYPVVLYPVAGWIEEMRFSDIVRYSGPSYTVPTESFVTDANTRALWHFDEAPGSTIFADSSGNGNTLTGQNGAHTGTP
jgi:hypothetical protein